MKGKPKYPVMVRGVSRGDGLGAFEAVVGLPFMGQAEVVSKIVEDEGMSGPNCRLTQITVYGAGNKVLFQGAKFNFEGVYYD